jgi:UDP-glucose 4-epimerase
VADVVEALRAAAAAQQVNRMVLNVGSGRETSVADLVRAVEAAVGHEVPQVANREKGGGVRRLVADISRAEALLGFRPRVSLADGLRATLAEDPRFQFTPSATGAAH